MRYKPYSLCANVDFCIHFPSAAIKYDNIDVFGYTAWSLLDGFEWQHAYSTRRGLFYIDFNSKEKKRVPKSSALYYKQIIKENGFPMKESTPALHSQFPCDFFWGMTESVIKVSIFWLCSEVCQHHVQIVLVPLLLLPPLYFNSRPLSLMKLLFTGIPECKLEFVSHTPC